VPTLTGLLLLGKEQAQREQVDTHGVIRRAEVIELCRLSEG